MTIFPLSAVYDCNVLLQAMILPRGPARAAIEAVRDGRLALFLSEYITEELQRAASRPQFAVRFSLTGEKVTAFMASLAQISHYVPTVPSVLECSRDPGDAHYIDLAVAAPAALIVSRDNDLLALGNRSTTEGRDFAARFPGLTILTPPQLLQLLQASSP
ncbi:MAG: putative toxin-antitoxin system toxin component, PIN family [Pirellulales bacterium]|nr:putative toxin-antitoxin system toxin component, PIN family [Pirellulales bacterium]